MWSATRNNHNLLTAVVVFGWVLLWSSVFLIFLSFPTDVAKAEITKGYYWTVTEVYDGDTFTVDKKFYPEELGNIKVRIKGIDTGELGYRAKCNLEAKKAEEAKAFLQTKLLGKKVTIKNVEADKYGNRVVADVYIDKIKISNELLRLELAKPYDGGKKSPWCDPFVL